MSESEELQIRRGLEANDESPWEWGVYVERNDGRRGEDRWTPLVYGEMESFDDARQRWRDFCTQPLGLYRNQRIVRRAVSPWEVFPR